MTLADLRQAVLASRRSSAAVVLAVGEINPYGSNPDFALWHEPRNASGDRLRRIMGLTDEQYLANVARVNLCTGKWSTPKARETFLAMDRSPYAVVIFLGAKVRVACGGPSPFALYGGPERGPVFVGLPHPSGLCRTWNEPGAVDRARAALAAAAPGLPWGTAEDKL